MAAGKATDIGFSDALKATEDCVDGPFTLSLVIVCFNSSTPLERLLSFLHASGPVDFIQDIILVNNSPCDRERIASIGTTFGCTVINSGENLGFGAACNLGFSMSAADGVVFLNPDVLISAGSLRVLRDNLKNCDQTVACGPIILDGLRRRRLKCSSVADPNPRASTPVFRRRLDVVETYFLPGCAMAVKAAAFREVGGFDESFFLFYEDDDLSIRLSEYGRIVRLEASVAVHRHGQSAPDSEEMRRFRAWHLGFSFVTAMRKHRSASGTLMATILLACRAFSPLNFISVRYRRKSIGMVSGGLVALCGTRSTPVVAKPSLHGVN